MIKFNWRILFALIGIPSLVNAQNQPITVADIDGNVYKTVQIGNQLWMAENLRTTKFNNGKVIPKTTDKANWKGMMSGGVCTYDDRSANGKTYGALYNWYAVRAQKVCPTGWHVPSDAEWDTLAVALGGTKIGATRREEVELLEVGGKLKSTDTTLWQSPNIGATNETGFSALPGGYRTSGGVYEQQGSSGYWWSSSLSNSYGSFCRFMKYNSASLNKINLSKTYGFSVRCLKD
jgi:uncharacterized protein (TIGR02145 family)